jgi:leader peptidase (prepilin peptidase) / N-methyltransferase
MTLFGAVMGSFLATLVVRWPQGESAMGGRSRCDHCKMQLSTINLVPILSYAFQSGKCKACGGRIAADHIVIEISAAAVAGVSALLLAPLPALVAAAFGWVLLTLAVLDLRHFWLPDRLTLPLLFFGMVINAISSGIGLEASVIGALVGYLSLWGINVAFRMLRQRDGLGGGDAKLFAAIGAWVGWSVLPLVLLGASIVGICAILSMRLRGREIEQGTAVPFGACLALVAWPLWIACQRGWL